MARAAAMAVVAGLLVSTGSALADEADEKAKLARELVALQMSAEQWKGMMDAMTSPLAGKARLSLTQAITYQEVSDFTLGLYVKNYSKDELQQLVTFHGSEVGRKASRLAPEIMKDTMGWIATKVPPRATSAAPKKTP